MKNKLLAIMAILLGGLFFGCVSVLAFDAEELDSTMTISPPRQRIILVPGETYNGSIIVSNPNLAKSDLKYSVTIGSFSLGKDENGRTDYNDTDVDTMTEYNQIMDWITLGKESGEVAPNNKDIIPFVINVPMNAPAGGQYATIIVQDDTAEDGVGSLSVRNIVRFASVIFADVAGETMQDGAVVENNVPIVSTSTPLTVSSLVENNGNVHTDAEYILQVYTLFSGEEVYSSEEDPETELIMPESSRFNTVSWDGAPAIGIFRVRQVVRIFNKESVVEKIVLICPLWLMVTVIFVVVALVIYLVFKRKSPKS